ncbi:MAG TPA: AsmA family protein [Stellaceae bacterium]|nr:AsmA family protein [Stellaceae bacterium]
MSGRAPPRRRVLKAALLALAALVLIVAGATAIFVLTFDANRWKPRIVAAVRQATGRQIALNGPIGLKLSLQPTIEASDVVLANPPGFSRPDLAKIGALDLQLDLLALLRGRYVIERLVVAEPDILFERTAAGAANWSLAQPAGASPAAPAKSSAGPGKLSIAVQNFTLRGGRIGYRDDRAGNLVAVTIGRLGLEAAGAASGMRLTADAKIGKTPVTLSAQLGSLQRLLTGGSGAPWPIKAQLEAAGATVAIDGTIGDPLAGTGYRIAIRGAIPDLAALSEVAGGKLPAMKQVAFSARLGPALPSGLAVDDLKLTSAQGDLSGRLTLRLGAPPDIVADLSSTRLDAGAFFGPGAGAAGPVSGPAPSGAPLQRAGGLIPDTPLPVTRLRGFDADLRFLFADLIVRGQHWRGVAGRLVLAGGKLRLDPFAITTPGGKLALTLTADAAQPVPPVALTLRAPAYSLAALLAAAGTHARASGQVAITADLRGAGSSPHAIAAGLNGTLVATMNGGRIDYRGLTGGIGKILAATNPSGLLGGSDSGDIRCMELRLVARNGVATLAPFVLVSTLTSVEGSGSLAFGPETMNLTLRPHGSVRGKAFSAAVAVRGSFANPQVAVDAAGTAAGVGGLVGQFAGKIPGLTKTAAPTCAPAGNAGSPAAPARTTPQLPNPTNLLKNLFR